MANETPTPTPAKPEEGDQPKLVIKEGVLKAADLPEAYREFKKPISEEGLQQSMGAETQKGYDTLGYGYAWITERLNDVIGFCWRAVIQNDKATITKTHSGKEMWEVQMDVWLQLGNVRELEFDDIDPEKKTCVRKYEPDFQILAQHVGFGWHKAFSIADARKGAYTNGLKKAAALFGIGNEAYKKSIDEENQSVQEALAKKGKGKKFAAPAAEKDYLALIKAEIVKIHPEIKTMTPNEATARALEVFCELSGLKWRSFNVTSAQAKAGYMNLLNNRSKYGRI